MKNRSLSAQLLSGLLLTIAALALAGCGQVLYKLPANNYAGRPIPPSKLLQRVMVAYSANGSSGGLQILDGLRDLRSNVQNTIPAFSIAGFSAAQPTTILNYPEETSGYVLSYTDGSLIKVNYSTESSLGQVAGFGAYTPSAVATPDGQYYAGAAESAGILGVSSSSPTGPGAFSMNLPNVYKVVTNRGNSVILAMVRNSNSLYRVIKLPATNNPAIPPGSVDCQPLILPVYCVVPVKGTYDRPSDAYFSTDGNSVYILNCGPECGGATSGVTVLQVGQLLITSVPSVDPLSAAAPSPLQSLPVANPIPIPGGVTTALSDGSTLYLAGQSKFSLNSNGTIGSTPRADGLFTGFLTTINQSTYAVSNPLPISDGTHTKLLFADDNTLWVGASQCANGERAATGGNYNCLTLVKLGSTLTSQIIPDVTPGGSKTVPFPNENQNPYYYGSLTGICWVQNYHKVYTAYGGQVHAFYTGGAITAENDPARYTTPAAGTEKDNTYISVQGTVLDVAYMDALTNSAN